MNLPVAGFIEERVKKRGHEVAAHAGRAAASPSAPRRPPDAYERILGGMIVDDLKKALGRFDAVYLALHGAMASGPRRRGRRGRAPGAGAQDHLGPDIPLVASLDLHSNTTKPMMDKRRTS